MHILSPEGIAHTLEDHVDGGGRYSSIVAMVFKHLLDDIHDSDTIRTVIRRYSVNSDDKIPTATRLSSTPQAEDIKQTYKNADLNLSKTGYIH
ncbi:hypothetical protein N7527_010520 [Penicillium freii]|uniref:Uncharacterized protein n=1 Tax=Penicillium freii TaxID=48697 RepID=A0A117NNN8_PENFR|nr:hypothetical protein N7527_010520 [Penicillium freii]KUM61128.1 hypothetical protein ACN42_g6012 [Penicillium freii]